MQGFVGWWMVKSGLQQPKSEHAVPRVSPYRLAAHLTSAFAIYCTLLWTTLSLAFPTAPSMTASLAETNACAVLRRRALPLAALIGLTAVSGGPTAHRVCCCPPSPSCRCYAAILFHSGRVQL